MPAKWLVCTSCELGPGYARLIMPVSDFEQAYARIGMAKEAADAASQAKDGELLGRLKLTFAQNAAASSIFDTLRDRLSFQGVS